MDRRFLAAPRGAIAHYQNLYEQHKEDPQSLGWTDEGRMLLRWEALSKDIRNGCSVLDYGCGLGDFNAYLQDHRKLEVNYRGADIVREFIDVAMARQHNAQFQHIQSAEDIQTNADHIVICGVFNLITTPPEWHIHHIAATLEHLIERCNVALHVDFLIPDPDWKDAGLYYHSMHTLINQAKLLSRRFTIDRSYLPYEYCVHFYKDIAINPETHAYLNGV